MRVTGVYLQNFGSYEELSFSPASQGLTLVQGSTGAGKSTVFDAIPWLLFGKTAKGGSVDEVLSWPGDKITAGYVTVAPNLMVTRTRGPKARDNDLWFCIGDSQEVRGKDLNDTQRLLNQQLGFDYDTYLSGSYFHEFSQTAQFFTASAKVRRMICEQIVDLSFVSKLQEKTKEFAANNLREVSETNKSYDEAKYKLGVLKRMQHTESTKHTVWEETHKKNTAYTQSCFDRFEMQREKIISNKCPSCGTQLKKPTKVYDDSPNPHAARLEELRKETSPHTAGMKDFSSDIAEVEVSIASNRERAVQLDTRELDAEILNGVLQILRVSTIQDSIKQLEDSTNKLLSDHFDAEIQVEFLSQDNDKLEALIQKDGNACSFTQLSKGQRQLLKLCFGVAVMQAVSEQHGVKFEHLFFDEALSGLDDTMKTKAYRLLETLPQSHDSVFVIDHSEQLKSLFSSVYSVELVSGKSEIKRT